MVFIEIWSKDLGFISKFCNFSILKLNFAVKNALNALNAIISEKYFGKFLDTPLTQMIKITWNLVQIILGVYSKKLS